MVYRNFSIEYNEGIRTVLFHYICKHLCRFRNNEKQKLKLSCGHQKPTIEETAHKFLSRWQVHVFYFWLNNMLFHVRGLRCDLNSETESCWPLFNDWPPKWLDVVHVTVYINSACRPAGPGWCPLNFYHCVSLQKQITSPKNTLNCIFILVISCLWTYTII